MKKKIWFDKWARLYQNKILNHLELPDRIKKEDIKEIYFLFFCVYTLSNEKNILELLHQGKMKKIKSVISKTPIDFDSTDYPVIRVFQIESTTEIFLLVTKEDESYQQMEVVYTIKAKTTFVDAFETSKLIYLA